MPRISGHTQHVDRHHPPLFWHAGGDYYLVAGLARPIARLDHIARIAERNAQIAIGEVVDVLRGVEFPDVGADLFEGGECLVEIPVVATLRVEPEIDKRRREDLLRRVE